LNVEWSLEFSSLSLILPAMSSLVQNLNDHLVSRLAGADGAATAEPEDSPAREQMRAAVGSLTGIWAGRGPADELMS
jgi:hypothetical protein